MASCLQGYLVRMCPDCGQMERIKPAFLSSPQKTRLNTIASIPAGERTNIPARIPRFYELFPHENRR